MPITRKRFDEIRTAEKIPLPDRILAFLSNHRDSAYSLPEILHEVGGYDIDTPGDSVPMLSGFIPNVAPTNVVEDYQKTINELERAGKVLIATEKSVRYYSVSPLPQGSVKQSAFTGRE